MNRCHPIVRGAADERLPGVEKIPDALPAFSFLADARFSETANLASELRMRDFFSKKLPH